ncbi:MAG: antibiotic biosynthesis monooxygenase [Colwellia sp.]|nr:antibiotic biosynthesis monooxygenase [Colwellia sp.]
MSEITLQGHIIVPDADLDTVKSELLIHTKLTKQETGCLLFNVTVDKNNPNKFDVYEKFVNQAAFDIHQNRVKNSNWGKVTHRVKRHYQVNQ